MALRTISEREFARRVLTPPAAGLPQSRQQVTRPDSTSLERPGKTVRGASPFFRLVIRVGQSAMTFKIPD